MSLIKYLLFLIVILQSNLVSSQFPVNLDKPQVILKNNVIKHTEYTENDSISYFYNSIGRIDHSLNVINGNAYIYKEGTLKSRKHNQFWINSYEYDEFGNLIKEALTLKEKTDGIFTLQHSIIYAYNKSNLIIKKAFYNSSGNLSKIHKYYYKDSLLTKTLYGDISCHSSLSDTSPKCDSTLYFYNTIGQHVKSENYTNGTFNDSTNISYFKDKTTFKSINTQTKKTNRTLILRDNKSRIIEVNKVNDFETKWYFLENGLIDYQETEYFKTKKIIRTVYKYETKLKNKN